jgi:hypothetical protein
VSTGLLSPHRLVASLALAAIALGATACSSSSSPSTTTTTGGSGATTTTAAGGSTTSTTAAGGASLAQIEAKLQDGQSATFLATYKLTSKSTGKTTNGTITIAHDGSDSLFGFTETSATFEEIATGSKSVICSKSSGAWQCYSGALGTTIGASLAGIEDLYGSKAALGALKADSAVAGVKESTSSVDGTAVTCFTFHATTTTGSWTYCVTGNGVLAEANTQNTAGTSSLVLTSLTSSVSASEFTPPATPTSSSS